MIRPQFDQRAPEVELHGSATRELALNIPVTGGVITSPVLTMKTRGGDRFTAEPGLGAVSMVATASLRLVWSSADMAALNRSTRPVEYRFDVEGVVDGGVVGQVIAGNLTVYPTTWGRPIPRNELGTLVLNGGSTITIAVTVPTPDGPIDGGRADEVYSSRLPRLDGGTATTTFTETIYDGGRA
jgi:hypothetical protein